MTGQYREPRRKGNGEYMSTYQKRQAWTPEEDEILKQQVERLGTHCWPDVASGLVGRTSKACSLRWRCFLSPSIIRPNEDPFSQWEIAVIVLTQKMFGNKWNDIANYLPMRCNNDIKNHFNLYLKDKQSSVSLENSYLRAGYDLPSLLAAEPEDVATRRERLEKERAANNNFDPVPVKNSSRGMSYLRRAAAAPIKPKSPMTARFHPYHMGASSAVLAAAAQPGGALAMGRPGAGSSLAGGAMAGSYTAKHHTSYATFAALPRPHSSQSMGALDGLALAGGLRGTSAAAAAGLPGSLLSYGALGGGASYAQSSLMGGTMLPEQLLRLPSSSMPKQEQGLGDAAAAAGGMYSSFTAGSSFVGLSGGVSSTAGDWQANSTQSALHMVGGAGLDGAVTRVPSRLQHAGLPDLTMPVQRGNSLSFTGGHHGLTQQVMQQQQQQQGLDASGKLQQSSHIGLPVFDKMPSLPDPSSEPGILDGCGDGDGTSLRGIFSSDDGEPFGAAHQQQQQQQQQGLAGSAPKLLPLQQQGSGSYQLQQSSQFLGGGMDLAAAAGTSSQQHGSPTGQQLHAGAYASPNSFTSGCSPVPLAQSMLMQQQQQHPQQHSSAAATAPDAAAAAALNSFRQAVQLKIECGEGGAGCDGAVVAGGERGALSAPCTVTAAYTPSGYNQQQQQPQQQQHMLPQGAFTQGGQQQQQSLLSQMCPQQQQGRYTPFQHPENQQQHMNHICQDQGPAAQQQQQQTHPAAAYQPALAGGLPGYDSGNSSHHHQQQPGHGLCSPSTIAASAVAAVTRGCALTGGAAAQSWGSSPTSQQQQQQQQLHVHQLISQVVSDDADHDLGQLVDLLDAAGCDGDCSGDGCGGSGGHASEHHHGLVVDVDGGDCGLMLSDGDFDDDALPADYLPGLPGLKRQNSELEMMAAAACW
uniref:Uncharacterized protein n=1 Tax=Tetradesmus obliquus TaxID=3088 RepID=A0A383V1U3_TETOB|eukprot:jgi/Sobl393_1/7737/SZX59505.1